MRQRIEIPPPIGGINRNWSYSSQPPSTVREGQNMRSIDPVTGRTRPSQRSGSSKFTTTIIPGSGRVQNLRAITSDVPTSNYLRVPIGVNPEEVWRVESASGRGFVAVVAIPGGGVIAMDDRGAFTQYSADGEKKEGGNFPKPQSEIQLHRLVRDIEGGLISASYQPDGNGSSTIYRMRNLEGQGWVLHWSLEVIQSQVSDIQGEFGNIYFAGNRVDPVSGEGISKAYLYAQGLTSLPVMVWTKTVPNPVQAISIGPGGSLYVASPANADRSMVASGFLASEVNWTPRQIADQNRIYSWWDASDLREMTVSGGIIIDPPEADGDDYGSLLDLRYNEAEFNPTDFLSSRPLSEDPEGLHVNSTYPATYPHPQYNPSAMALGAMRFGTDGTPSVRITKQTASGAVKADVDASLTSAGAVFPGYAGAIFTTYMVVTIEPSTTDIGVLLQQSTRAWRDTDPVHASYGLLTNSGDNAVLTEGELWFDVAGVTNSSNVPAGGLRLLPARFDADARNVALITFQHSGTGATTSCFRVNGVQIDNFNLDYDESWGENSGVTDTIFGFRQFRRDFGPDGQPFGLTTPFNPALHNGWAVGPNPNTWEIEVRGNGVPLGRHTTAINLSNPGATYPNAVGSAALVLVAGDWHVDTSPTTDDVLTVFWQNFVTNGNITRNVSGEGDEKYVATTHGAFKGHIAECITVLGEHVSGVHDGVPDSGATEPIYEATLGYSSAFDVGDPLAPVIPSEAQVSELEFIEGYLAHKWGFPDLLPNGESRTASGGYYLNHAFGGEGNVPGGMGTNEAGDTSGNLKSAEPILAKYFSDGAFAWAHTGSGIGAGVDYYRNAEDDEDWIYSLGNVATETGQVVNPDPNTPQSPPNYAVRRILDLGPGFSVETADGAWLTDNEYAIYDTAAPIAVEPNGDVWFAKGRYDAGPTPRLVNGMDRYAEGDGVKQSGVSFDLLNPGRRLNGIALDPDIPRYRPGEENLGGDHLYAVIGDDNLPGVAGELIKIRTVTETKIPGAQPRSSRVIAVRGGEVSVLDKGGVPVSMGVAAGDLLDPDADVYSAYLFEKIYFIDGEKYKVYDPSEGANGTLEDWKATEGAIPARARLICPWRGRIVLARFGNNPSGWAMSRVLDPLDWNESPAVIAPDMPVTGRTAPSAADIPDIINAIIPYNDDMLVFGCDSSIYRLTGDPLLGGQVDLISDVTGIAFGAPHTKDPSGVLYFFGSKGGVWAMPPGNAPVNLVEHRLEREFQSVDRSLFKVQMQWDYANEGLNVFIIGLVDGTTHESWFWDKKNDAWWPDTYGQAVTATATFDGDGPSDRAVLLGGEDGYVRFIDPTASTDDTVRIDSSILIGPITGREQRVLASKLEVLLEHDQGAITYELLTGENPAQFGTPELEGAFEPGYSDNQLFRISANQFWVRLRSATASRWALESAALYLTQGGRRRGS